MQELDEYGLKEDKDIDLGQMALDLSRDDHVGVSVDRYESHFKKLRKEVAARYDELIKSGAEDDAGVRVAALKHVLSDIHDYRVDTDEHEILESADIMRVIDRALGCRTALCLLYMDIARAQGWIIEGLNFPNYFLCRIEKDGERLIFDPSQGCRVLEAQDLRAIVKDALGDQAELSNDYYEGVDGRATVIHLYNFIKTRYIEVGNYSAAIAIVERMRSVAPDEYRLLLDAGVLYARLDEREKAIECLNEYIDKAPNYYDREDARLLLGELLSE